MNEHDVKKKLKKIRGLSFRTRPKVKDEWGALSGRPKKNTRGLCRDCGESIGPSMTVCPLCENK